MPGTASTPRLDLALDRAPSIAAWRMLGLMSADQVSDCTTSGQSWQVSEKYILKIMFAGQRLDLVDHRLPPPWAGCPPAHSRASTSEVNSCPSGRPAKRMPVGLPGSPMENDGLRCVVVARLDHRNAVRQRGDFTAAGLATRRDFGESSSEATISIGRLTFSRYAFN